MFEAQAIAIEMEKIVSNRPMTHDLFKSFALSFGIQIQEIVISDLKEGVFYAKIVCAKEDGSNFVELDARPSDAVAIGIRFGTPIYAFETVMAEAGIEMSDIEDTEDEEDFEETVPAPRKSSGYDPESLSSISTEQLKMMMQAAIEREDYEKAAKIRDELNRRA